MNSNQPLTAARSLEAIVGSPVADDVLRFLASPDAHEGCERVERIETHLSWVFLSDRHVLKLKKPVRTALVDLRTLEGRESNAREELRLNRRLAPKVYLDVLALKRGAQGFALVPSAIESGNSSEVVDWLVWMRRLPSLLMMDNLLRARCLSRTHVRELAVLLARFYASAEPSSVGVDDHRERLDGQLQLDRQVLLDKRFDLPDVRGTLDQLDRLRVECRSAWQERLAEGRIVEGHGDLRPEHVCLQHPPAVIDCLEFNRALREVDPFAEMVALGVECAMLGCAWLGPALTARCSRLLGDRPPPMLLRFHAARHAVLRARMCCAHLLEPNPRAPERWQPLAKRYLELARLLMAAGIGKSA